MNKLQQMHDLGQSTWLNYLHRPFIQSGELRQHVADGIQGFTANATSFDTTLMTTTSYDDAVWELVRGGVPAPQIAQKLVFHDAQIAADYMHNLYEQSNGLEGFVSLELNPNLMNDTVNTVAEVTHLEAVINRANVIVEIPATPAGIEAIRLLTRDGVRINVTHIFSVDVYEQVAKAYLDGLEIFLETHSVWRFVPNSVASFSLSPIDEAVDTLLGDKGRPELLGKTAVSQAKLLYDRSQQLFSGPRWDKMAKKGGHILRPKWSRTTPRNPSYAELYYIEALIGQNCVTTFAPATLNAFGKHGKVEQTVTKDIDQAYVHMNQLALEGVDIVAVAQGLQQEYLRLSEKQFQLITQHISKKRDELELKWQQTGLHPSQIVETPVSQARRR